MTKVSLSEASLIKEQDRTPECASCSAMADEGEMYCMHCKSYWEEDVPWMNAMSDRREMEDEGIL